MKPNYTAVVQQRDEWWIEWIEEVPGVNSQGATREELLENLSSALGEALEMNRSDALSAADGPGEHRRVKAGALLAHIHLTAHGCYLVREGAQHSWWGNPANGRRSAVPRHTEIDEYLARKICRDLGIPEA